MGVHYGSVTKWAFLDPDFGNQMTFFGGCVSKTELFFWPRVCQNIKINWSNHQNPQKMQHRLKNSIQISVQMHTPHPVGNSRIEMVHNMSLSIQVQSTGLYNFEWDYISAALCPTGLNTIF